MECPTKVNPLIWIELGFISIHLQMRFLKWSIIGVRSCWPWEHAQSALQLYFNKRLRNLMHQGLLLVMLLQQWDFCPHQFEIDAPSFWDVGHVLSGTKIIVATQSIWVFIFFSINLGHYHWHCVVFGTLWFTSPLSSWHAFLHIMFFFVTLHDLNKDIKTFNVFFKDKHHYFKVVEIYNKTHSSES